MSWDDKDGDGSSLWDDWPGLPAKVRISTIFMGRCGDAVAVVCTNAAEVVSAQRSRLRGKVRNTEIQADNSYQMLSRITKPFALQFIELPYYRYRYREKKAIIFLQRSF